MRFAHWCHAAFFAGLTCTAALLIWSPAARALAIGEHRVLPLVHIALGLGFVAVPFGPALLGRGGSILREAAHLGRWYPADLVWILVAPLGWVGLLRVPPPRGKYNRGQRLNAAWTAISSSLLLLTGIVIWNGRGASLRIREAAYEWHAFIALLAVAVVLGHIVMALTHWHSLRGMITGSVDAGWAARRYPFWRESTDDPETSPAARS